MLRRHTLLLLWVAYASTALAAQSVTVQASDIRVFGSKPAEPEEPIASRSAREAIQRLTGPSEAATQTLQSGFLKLKRLCEYGRSNPPASDIELPPMTPKAREELTILARSLERITSDYQKSSRISTQANCRYLPMMLLSGSACQGFKEDTERLRTAEQTASRLVSLAQDRLKLYDQYVELERQGCTRTGFARKLWASEESNLWPLLMEAPAAFQQFLPTAPAN